jgi:sugar-specific transcriptional regulator TrmB
MIRAEDIEDLICLGLTPSQAKLYLSILKIGQADGKAIAKHSGVARQEVYRIIGELEEKGLIEKVIAKPYEFRGVPLQFGVSRLLALKSEEYDLAKEKSWGLIKRFQPKEEEISADYLMTLIPKGDTLAKRVINELRISQQSVDIVTTVQRLMQSTDLYTPIREAINRGVQLRVITEKPCNKQAFLRELKGLLEEGLKLKCLPRIPKAKTAIFDQKVAIVTLYPAIYAKESICMWTNYPIILASYQDYFNIMWRDSEFSKKEMANVKIMQENRLIKEGVNQCP